MDFELVTELTHIKIIARGKGIRELDRLRTMYGGRNWRKLKGRAKVRLKKGQIRYAEVHWYEAHGVGRRKFKISHFLDD
jgi:hypothetical protein